MENVMKFPQRARRPNSMLDLADRIIAIQVSQEDTVRKFVAGIEALGDSLRDIEAMVDRVDDAEAREKVRLRSISIRREVAVALRNWLNEAI